MSYSVIQHEHYDEVLETEGEFRAFIPKGKMKKLVVFCHGFPGKCKLSWAPHRLVQRGVGWLEVRYDGDRDYGRGEFSFLGSIDNIRHRIAKAKSIWPGVPICLLGHSYGAFCVLNALRAHRHLCDEVKVLNPLVDVSILQKPEIVREVWEGAEKLLILKQDRAFYEDEIRRAIIWHNPYDFVHEIDGVHAIQCIDDEVLSFVKFLVFLLRLSNKRKHTFLNGSHGLHEGSDELIEILAT